MVLMTSLILDHGTGDVPVAQLVVRIVWPQPRSFWKAGLRARCVLSAGHFQKLTADGAVGPIPVQREAEPLPGAWCLEVLGRA